MSYKIRKISVQFVLENGKSFDDKGSTVLSIESARCYAAISGYGGMSGTEMTLQIWGLSIDHMAVLSYKGVWIDGPQFNRMKVWADDEPIFEGFIYDAMGDYNQAPDIPLVLSANAHYKGQAEKAAPFSASGSQTAEKVISAMAASAGLSFVNNGAVGLPLSDPYYQGNIVQQMRTAASDAGVNLTIGISTVTMWPQNGVVDGVKLYTSPEKGMIGYPIFTDKGLLVITSFSSDIVVGRQITVETSLPNASGDYQISGAMHYITSWIEGGQWNSSMELIKMNTKAIRY
ncbi:baseplate hub protein [Serratia nevei]|uniref:baseplate hub protein n=1 Tax=Serratia nevei TaxID=2703794 RepID=UPI003FA71496